MMCTRLSSIARRLRGDCTSRRLAPDTTLKLMRAAIVDLQQGMLDPVGLKQLEEQFITEYFLDNETNAAQADFLARSQLYEGDLPGSRSLRGRVEERNSGSGSESREEIHERIPLRVCRRSIEAGSTDDQFVLTTASNADGIAAIPRIPRPRPVDPSHHCKAPSQRWRPQHRGPPGRADR